MLIFPLVLVTIKVSVYYTSTDITENYKSEAIVTYKPLSMNLHGITSWPNYDTPLLFSILYSNSILKMRIDQKIAPLDDHLVERFILYKLLEGFLCFVRLKK